MDETSTLHCQSEVSEFVNILLSANLHNFVEGPTHKLGHQLDFVIAIVEDHLVKDCKVHENLMSDHHSVHIKLNRKKPQLPRSYTHCRDYRSV